MWLLVFNCVFCLLCAFWCLAVFCDWYALDCFWFAVCLWVFICCLATGSLVDCGVSGLAVFVCFDSLSG